MNIQVNATKRVAGRKSLTKQLRRDGLIPAIIYSDGKEGSLITFKRKSFNQLYKKSIGQIAFFEINVEGTTYTTILKDRQIHPVSREFVHIDFLELHAGTEITLKIPITYTGDPIGLKEGGVLEIIQRKMEITCLPKDIPENITIDLSELKIGSTLHFSDIEMPANVASSLSDESALVSVNTPNVIEEEEESEEEEEETLPVAE